MSLGKKLSIGDSVHFFRAGSSQPIAAIVTAILPSGENRQIALIAFAPGDSGEPVANVQHASLADTSAPRWDWPQPGRALSL